ncbi:MAG: SCO family protein [Aquaticitalea sp.]
MFLIFFGCHSDSKELPVLSYKINHDGEKVNYTVTYDNFTNQLGQPFSTRNIQNKVVIANFFFTRCPSICPPMRTEFIKIAESFQSEDDFMIVSHTIDPKNDTIEVLKNYAAATEIPLEKWQFVRASDEHTKDQAKQYMTNFKPNENGTDFYHSSYVALVDKNQQIRGFYNILVNVEVERLKEDINFLLHH